MNFRPRKTELAIALAALALALPASAGAVQRYATPTGSGDPNTCAAVAPCNIIDATNSTYTNDGDEVILAAGEYNVGATPFGIADQVDVHGPGAPQQTKIVGTGTFVVAINNALAKLRNVTVEHSVGGTGGVYIANGLLQSSIVSTQSAWGCAAMNATIRDSVCIAKGPGTVAMGVNEGGAGTATVTLRNVTAIGSGAGTHAVRIYADTGRAVSIDAKNVIARGLGFDVSASVTAGATANISLSNSNYSTTNSTGGATITDPTTNSNQMTTPVFVNAAIDDYHQVAGSPTIDAGTIDGLIGLFDFDGESRTMGAATDIGADEFLVAAATPPPADPGDVTAPQTSIAKKPKRKTVSRRVKFTFRSNETGSTFRCKLDRGTYRSCSSSYTKRVKPGKHVLRVFAIDAAGNADASPAVWRWRVLR
ncbi:MAG: hypothetical protein HZB14_03425 [Actinobacteria bacterium]|nr:hypothetical protein [Actinomycetota bacterium]